MDLAAIQEHWSNWAQAYGTELRATTKARTAKILELDALQRRLEQAVGGRPARILEMGCGNGINCVELARRFPQAVFHGVDFIGDMVAAARENAREAQVHERTRFFVGDATRIGAVEDLEDSYDVVFTDRCLINLNDAELQGAAIGSLAGKVASGGCLLMIENSLATYALQNRARIALGLEPRKPAEFNRFFGESEMREHVAKAGLELKEIEDFSSLHDIVLYALLPSVNGGEIDYDHPLVKAAAKLSVEMSAAQKSPFGDFGQNRLYVCGKS